MATKTFGRQSAEQQVVSPLYGTRERLAQRRAARLGRQIGFMAWARKVPEPKSGPLNFTIFPPQVELYEEGVHEKEAVVMKGTQVGVSAWAMRWALFHADTKGRTALYVFPTARDMYDYSTLRVKPLIDGSSYLLSRKAPDDPDNKGMKGVGLGVVVFRGSESKRGLDSVDADIIVFDEYDTLEQANIPDAEKRVSSPLSPGLIRRVGVPSIPDYSIAKLYDQSDQRRWMTKCEGCNEWQQIDFFKNVTDEGVRVCRKCRKPVNVADGQWVAEFPDRDVRGYHYTRLDLPTADLKQVILESQKRGASEKQVFMNKTLGLPWAPEEGRLSRKAIQAAQSAGGGYTACTNIDDAIAETAPLVTMGVDVATTRNLNVRVSAHFEQGGIDKKRALFIGEVEDFQDLVKLMDFYAVHMAAVDHEPDGRLARALAERYPGRVYVTALSGAVGRHAVQQVINVDDDMMTASVRRTIAIDAMHEMVRTQRNWLPINLPEQPQNYIEHMQANIRVILEDEFGKKTAVYRNTVPNDYAMAEVFDVIATDLYWRRQDLGELESEDITTLDDEIEFERSHLSEWRDRPGDYVAGPGNHEGADPADLFRPRG